MSATMGGAIKALIEGAGLGVAVYRDRAPAGAPLPFVIVQEAIGAIDEAAGDFGALPGLGISPETREQHQLDLYQTKRGPSDGSRTEDYSLPWQIRTATHGRVLTEAPTRCYPVVVRDGPRRLPSGAEDDNLVRHSYTLETVRKV